MTGDDFSLDINNPKEPKILCVGNNPDRQNIDFNYSVAKFNLDTPHADRKGYNTTFSTNNVFTLNKAKTLKKAINFWYNFPSVDGIFENKSASSLSFMGLCRIEWVSLILLIYG